MIVGDIHHVDSNRGAGSALWLSEAEAHTIHYPNGDATHGFGQTTATISSASASTPSSPTTSAA